MKYTTLYHEHGYRLLQTASTLGGVDVLLFTPFGSRAYTLHYAYSTHAFNQTREWRRLTADEDIDLMPLDEMRAVLEALQVEGKAILRLADLTVYQVGERTEYGVVRLLFVGRGERRYALWSSHVQKFLATKTIKSIYEDYAGSMKEIRKYLKSLFPKSGYLFADPEIRDLLLEKPLPKDLPMARLPDRTE